MGRNNNKNKQLYCEKCGRPIPNEEIRTKTIGGSGWAGAGTKPGNYSKSASDKDPNLPPGTHRLWEDYSKTSVDTFGNFTDQKIIFYHFPNKEDIEGGE